MKKIGKIIGIALCICVIVCVALYLFRPYSPSVTVDGIKGGVVAGVSAQIDENCYELSASADFADVFSFKDWEQTRSEPTGEPTVRLRLAEQWIIELYADGKAAVHDGYASSKTKSDAYYSVPAESVETVAAYIEECGELQAKPFTAGHFLY